MKPPLPETASWLAQTRLRPPLPHTDSLPRERLRVLLRTALDHCRLVLLSAPAGTGKTTLLADWLSQQAKGERQKVKNLADAGETILPFHFSLLPSHVAWLSLDAEDDDPSRFLAALIAALGRVHPACGAGAAAVLAARAGPPDQAALARAVVAALINDILETIPDRFALVLDDLHLIESPTVYIALDQLISQMPAQMRLLIATRHDPPLSLARLRARRQLAELRLAELRFRDDEASALLTQVLGLDLSPQDLASIYARTEGWAAGLCLLAASLHAIEAPASRSTLLDSLAHTDRYVFDFLAEEVLSGLPPEVQTFLLETSILAELTPERCHAITRRDDAARLLEDLYRRNLVVSVATDHRPPTTDYRPPTTSESKSQDLATQNSNAQRAPETQNFLGQLTVYRYHALFRAFLRQRLDRQHPDRLADLHRRAAEAQPGTEQAIGHYLAAQLWQPAAFSIILASERLLQLGQLETLRRWIAALPEMLRETIPALLCLDGVAVMLQGAYRAAQPMLERARQLCVEQGDVKVEGEVLGALATCAYLQGDFAAVGALADAALEKPIGPRGRVQLLMSRAGQALFTGAWQRAAQDFDAALEVALASEQPYILAVMTFNLSPSFAVLPGRLAAVERFCQQVEPFAQPLSPLRLALLELQAFLHLWRGRLDQAIQAGEAALALKARLGGHHFLGLAAATTLADIYTARGAYDDAQRCFAALFEQLDRLPLVNPTLRHYAHARFYLVQGRLDDVRGIYSRLDSSANTIRSDLIPVARVALRGLLSQADRRINEAEVAFRMAVVLEQEQPIATLMGSARLLLARLLLDRGRTDDALAELQPVLDDCEQQMIAGPILLQGALAVPLLRLALARGVSAGLAARLLDQLGAPQQDPRSASQNNPPGYQSIPGTPELLSPREGEVLRLLVAGASNRQIAEQLVISDATAKTHVAHILQKLGVRSRTQAIARARELGLV